MIAYLIKSGLCLALLLVIYHLFLEREKMHQFNRYFLIFGLVFGLFTPLLTLNFGIETSIPTTNFQPTNIGSSLTNIDTSATAEPQKEWPIQEMMITLYGLGFFFFLFRFSRGIYAIFHRVRHSDSDQFRTSKLILVSEKVIPHSFLTYIFVNKDAYKSENIENEILEHEFVHLSQKHSLDILLVESLKIIFWFNPVFYFYKKAIQLNHEFIADDIVARKTLNISAYQHILLRHAQQSPQLQFASNFNFSLTKKRLIMMKKKSSNTMMTLKKALTIPVLIIAVFLFSGKSTAQDSIQIDDLYNNDTPPTLKNLQIKSHPDDKNVALIELRLMEDSPVLFQLSTNENDVSLVDKDLQAGSHQIHFDYANITSADFTYTFIAGRNDSVELNGPFIIDGKLQTIGTDTLDPPPPPQPDVPFENMTEEEKAEFDKAITEYQKAYMNYMRLDPAKTEMEELERLYQKVEEAAQEIGQVYKKISENDDKISPPMPIKIGPDPERRKLLSSEQSQKLKSAMEEARKERSQAYNDFSKLDPQEISWDKIKLEYEKLREISKRSHQAAIDYYESTGKIGPPPPPIPPMPPKPNKLKDQN